MPALERDVFAGNGHVVQLSVNQPTNLSIKPQPVSKYGWLPGASVAPPANNIPATKENTIFKEFAPKIPSMGKVKYPANTFRADGGPPMTKNPFFIRNRPHPNKVRHIKGLNDVPICTVFNSKYCEGEKQQAEPAGQMNGIPLGIQMTSVLPNKLLVEVPLGNLPRAEKCIPGFGMITMSPTWLSKLRQLTQDAGLQTQRSMPMFRTRSADDATMRPATNSRASRSSQRKAENDFVRRTASQGGERPSLSASAPERPTKSQDGVRFASNSRDEVRLPDIHAADAGLQGRRIPVEDKPNIAFPDGETFVFHVLGSLLDTEDVGAIQQWLATSPEQEKERVLEIIRRLADNNAEYREGVEQVISGNHHGSMLQHPDSIDKEGINSFNAERRQKVDEERRKEQETIRNYSPPLIKHMDQNIDRDIEKGSRQSERAREEATDVLCNLLNKGASREDQEIEEIRTKLASRSSSRGLLGKPQKREVRINSRIEE